MESNNYTEIYENINSLNEEEKKEALDLLILNAEELNINISQELNNPNTDEIGLEKLKNFLLNNLYDENFPYTDKQKDFLTSLIYDTEKFKEYVNKFYDVNNDELSNDEKKDALEKLVKYIEDKNDFSIDILNNKYIDKERVNEIILGMIPRLFNCTKKQKKYLINVITSGTILEIIEKYEITIQGTKKSFLDNNILFGINTIKIVNHEEFKNTKNKENNEEVREKEKNINKKDEKDN